MVVPTMQDPTEENHISMCDLGEFGTSITSFLILISKIRHPESAYSGYIDHQYYFDKPHSQKFLMGLFA